MDESDEVPPRVTPRGALSFPRAPFVPVRERLSFRAISETRGRCPEQGDFFQVVFYRGDGPGVGWGSRGGTGSRSPRRRRLREVGILEAPPFLPVVQAPSGLTTQKIQDAPLVGEVQLEEVGEGPPTGELSAPSGPIHIVRSLQEFLPHNSRSGPWSFYVWFSCTLW